MLKGGVLPWDVLEEMAARVHPFGWHVQLQCNGRELPELLDAVLASNPVTDSAVAVERRVVRSLGALVWLQQNHRGDERGRCSICRTTPRTWWRPWLRRSPCTVQTALTFQSDPYVLTDQPRPVSERGALY